MSQVTFLRVSLILEVAWEPGWPLPPGRALLLSLCLHSFVSKVGGRVPHMALWESDHGLLTEKVDVPWEGERRDHLLVGSDRPGPQGAQTAGGFSVSVSEAAARFPSAGRGEPGWHRVGVKAGVKAAANLPFRMTFARRGTCPVNLWES